MRDGYGPNDGKTAGVYAVDDEDGVAIHTEHPVCATWQPPGCTPRPFASDGLPTPNLLLACPR